jgi:predicted ATPase
LKYEACALFVERARSVQPRFLLTPDSAQAVLDICRQLDGIPLAIEMAAARTRMLSPGQIAARLSDRFRLLTDNGRLASARQQTLHALIDWSYDLLHKPEQILLRRLSVFANGWTLEAAEEVCTSAAGESENTPEIAPLDVFELLSQLVNKSMALTDYDTSGETRYHFLDTIRQYAWEKLVQEGEAESIQDQHLRYFLDFTSTAQPFLEGSAPGRGIEKFLVHAWLFR